jgi:hypothetical protein
MPQPKASARAISSFHSTCQMARVKQTPPAQHPFPLGFWISLAYLSYVRQSSPLRFKFIQFNMDLFRNRISLSGKRLSLNPGRLGRFRIRIACPSFQTPRPVA